MIRRASQQHLEHLTLAALFSALCRQRDLREKRQTSCPSTEKAVNWVLLVKFRTGFPQGTDSEATLCFSEFFFINIQILFHLLHPAHLCFNYPVFFFFYHSGKIVSPKWKSFKGLRLLWRDKIRLNNAIWRAWFIQCESSCASFHFQLLVNFCQRAEFIAPVIVANRPDLKAGNQPQTIRLPPTCLTVGITNT